METTLSSMHMLPEVVVAETTEVNPETTTEEPTVTLEVNLDQLYSFQTMSIRIPRKELLL